MVQRYLAAARRAWPALKTEHPLIQAESDINLVTLLAATPLLLLSLAWLVAETRLPLLAESWPLLVLLLGLLVLFTRLTFFIIVEVVPGSFGFTEDSFSALIYSTAALLFGPAALWLVVLGQIILTPFDLRSAQSAQGRLGTLRNAIMGTMANLLGGLAAFQVYAALGGQVPLPGLSPASAGLALIFVLLWSLINSLTWLPFLVALTARLDRVQHGAGRGLLRLSSIGFGTPFLITPFAILGAGLYAAGGLSMFLFFLAGWLLTSFLAHQLSSAIESSQQRSRELEKLEALGRAIMSSPPDGSGLKELLEAHLGGMFAYSRLEIHLYPSTTLFLLATRQEQLAPAAWQWLQEHPAGMVFSPRLARPWGEPAGGSGMILAPVVHPDSGELLGGIALSRYRNARRVGALLPAVQALAAQVASALHRAEIFAQTLAHQRVTHELELAGQIQSSFLPCELPHTPGWEFTAELDPARETSGDFYDMILLPGDCLGLLIADVADKGVGAALYMALSRTLIRTFAVEYPDRPDLALAAANHRILSDTQAEMFVTVFYAVLHPATGRLVYSNAGHNPPYLLRAAPSGDLIPLVRTGIPLGIYPDETWGMQEISIAPGDRLVLYSDGVTDAQDSTGDFFGKERLLDTLQTARRQPAGELQASILGAVQAFTGKTAQFDDITVMALSRQDGSPP